MKPDEHIFNKHWLYLWIDEEGIRTSGDYVKAIRKRGAFDHLRELSHSVLSEPIADKGNASASVLASRRLDLSGALSCPDFECQVPVINKVFGRVWHYFDSVVIEEDSLDGMLHSGNDVDDLLQRVRLFLYLRQVGAEKYLQYTKKISGLCGEHFREHAKENSLGLDVLFNEEFEREAVQKLKSESRFTIYRADDQWGYEIVHPSMGQLTGPVDHADPDRRPSDEEAARAAFGKCCTGLISDFSASRTLGLSLLEAAASSWQPASFSGELPNDRIVALNMRLPVLTNVPIKEVLKYREGNHASFELFRSTLRDAIRDQIERCGSDSPEAIADAVVAERIRPEIAKIEVQLSGIRKTLARKVGQNVVIAGATVSVGALESAPFMIAATAITGAAFAASIAQIVNKNADSRHEAEGSPWYFLWKAQTGHRR
jgi:hypothetical protein